MQMVTKAMTPKLGALPDFIDDFNGIFGFMDNITGVMSTIFGIDTGDSSIDNVLNNQELLQEMLDQMSTMQSSIQDILEQQGISADIEKQILALTTDLATSINTELGKIEGILNTYLPAISNMLSNIYEQTSVIDQKVDKLLALMTFALKELDYIKDNVVLNSSIVEITPHVQKLVYVNKKFLSLTRGFLQGEDVSIDSMQEIQEWAKSILATEMNSFEFSVDTLHNIIIGDNLYKRSALKTFSDVLLDDADQYGDFGTPLAKFYTFFSSLATLQINAYLCLTFARKVLGLSEIDYQVTMQDRIEQQNQMFVNLIQNKNYSNVLEIEGIYPMPQQSGDCNSLDLQAKSGYALIGLEFFMDNGIYKAKAYQAKIDKNFSIHADTVEEIISDDLSKVFLKTMNQSEYFRYPLFGELKGVPNTIITRIGFGTKYDESRKVKAFAYIDADFSPYDPKSGYISTEGTQTFQIEGTEDKNWCYSAWPIGLIGDLYMTPLKSLSLNVDVDLHGGNTLNMSGESYFSTILSREYNANFILFPYTNNSGLIDNNLIQNGNLEDQDKYWEGTEPSFFAEGEGTFGSNALKVQAQGAFDQIVKLEPNTTYRLTAFTKVKDSNYSKGKIGIRDMYDYRVEKSFLHTRYNQTKVEFTTGADTSKLSVFIQGGGDQESIAWADNIELYKVHQQDNMISDFDFDTYIYSNMCWKLSGGGDFVEKEGLFNSKALKITNSGGAEQEVKLKANTNYIFTAYVKVDNTTAQIGCGSNQVTCNSTSYTPVKLKFRTGEDPSTTEGSIYCSNPNDSGTVWADDFVLYEVPNLIINGDFEQMDLSSWNPSPTDVGKIYLRSGAGMSHSTAIVLAGEGQISQKVPLKPYTKYRLTAYVRVPNGVTALLGYGNGGNDDYRVHCTSTEFKQESLVFTTGANPLQSEDVIYLSTPDDGFKIATGDNFELYELDQIE
ncbi:vegetative insecticidal protein Vip3A family protein [Bacillus thuringiensis]|uniref:vegetative insecticidal protein Vip3A family protein n=1 Tax=Bacillus thuringiensis TaxID=1428 RepID=UPI001E3DB072|nr:vegetative insecticidal protein Vip3A family protein [Bacillus thuringiensis]MCC6080554.1 vegetative insecticidal protein Vip3A family protein [Bacillus thuringiensis]